MGRSAICFQCGGPVNRYDFPLRGNICFDCELTYNVYLGRRGLVSWMTKAKNVYRAARGSGHFPLTFNFVFLRDGRFIQCSYCGTFVYYRSITRDHVYPKSKGGLIKTPACIDCNIAKENMKPIEWALYAYNNNLDLATIPIGAEFMQTETEHLGTKKELLQQFVTVLLSYIGSMSVFQTEGRGSIPRSSTNLLEGVD